MTRVIIIEAQEPAECELFLKIASRSHDGPGV